MQRKEDETIQELKKIQQVIKTFINKRYGAEVIGTHIDLYNRIGAMIRDLEGASEEKIYLNYKFTYKEGDN